MLIVSGDDFGRNPLATENTAKCYVAGLLTSASSMVFMKGSESAAELARAYLMETGLHLNFSLPFNGPGLSDRLCQYQSLTIRYFRHGRWFRYVYNPFLVRAFDFLFKSQYEEYYRLYQQEPTHIDGHHHLHLCMNMCVNHVIPFGLRVRRNFTFEKKEKSFGNRTYRRILGLWLARHYLCTDYFFGVEPEFDSLRMQRIISLSGFATVEVMVHAENPNTFRYLNSRKYHDLLSFAVIGNFGHL